MKNYWKACKKLTQQKIKESMLTVLCVLLISLRWLNLSNII